MGLIESEYQYTPINEKIKQALPNLTFGPNTVTQFAVVDPEMETNEYLKRVVNALFHVVVQAFSEFRRNEKEDVLRVRYSRACEVFDDYCSMRELKITLMVKVIINEKDGTKTINEFKI